MSSASLRNFVRRRSATARHSARAASSVSCTKAVRMAAATIARLLTPACARQLRMKWTRQRCQPAWNTFLVAAVDLLAKPRHLALGDAGHAHRLDEIVDRTGRYTVYVGFLDHCDHRLVGRAARLEKRREIRALAKLGDRHRHGADAGVPLAR